MDLVTLTHVKLNKQRCPFLSLSCLMLQDHANSRVLTNRLHTKLYVTCQDKKPHCQCTLVLHCIQPHEKKHLVQKFHKIGLSVSYDRVLQISNKMANSVCSQYRKDNLFVHLCCVKANLQWLQLIILITT